MHAQPETTTTKTTHVLANKVLQQTKPKKKRKQSESQSKHAPRPSCLAHLARLLLLLAATVAQLSNVDTTPIASARWTDQCPCKCIRDGMSRRMILCDDRKLDEVPSDFNNTVEVFVINGERKPNNIKLAPQTFQQLEDLQELQITHSQIPTIPDHAFANSRNLRKIILSHNTLKSLSVHVFHNLAELVWLDLSHNQLNVLVSGVFHSLRALLVLDLSHNTIDRIESTIFMNLTNLIELNLSQNSKLVELPPFAFSKLLNLKRLDLTNCGLKHLHSLSLSGLKHLEDLNLADNRLQNVTQTDFRLVSRTLKRLILTSNSIRRIEDDAFNGFALLDLLNLSANRFEQLSDDVFRNASIRSLQLNNSSVLKRLGESLRPLSGRLSDLNLSRTPNLSPKQLLYLLQTVSSLATLTLSEMRLGPELSLLDALRSNAKTLTSLDLSGNRLESVAELPILKNLRFLSFANNRISKISRNATNAIWRTLNESKHLDHFELGRNPLVCDECSVGSFREYLHKERPTALLSSCQQNSADCILCSAPGYLRGQRLESLSELSDCELVRPKNGVRGLFLVIVIVGSIVILCLLSLAFVMWFRRTGIYYTNEQKQANEGGSKKSKLRSEANGRGQESAVDSNVQPIAIAASGDDEPIQKQHQQLQQQLQQHFRQMKEVAFNISNKSNNSIHSQNSNLNDSNIEKRVDSIETLEIRTGPTRLLDSLLAQADNLQCLRFADEQPASLDNASSGQNTNEDDEDEMFYQSESQLTMPSSMTLLETYVRSGGVGGGGGGADSASCGASSPFTNNNNNRFAGETMAKELHLV